MGVWDRFLNMMKLGDDEYDDDYLDDEYEYDEEEQPKKGGIFKRLEDEDDEYDEEEEFIPSERKRKTSQAARPVATSNKVTPMRGNKRANTSLEVCVIKPTSMEDTKDITETLLSNRPVVLNLEGLDVEVAQRIIDFTSGSTYAISGTLQKISNYIFIITPSSVDVSGDFQNVIGGAFDVPSIQTGF
jgi:Uncharacterized protein conserved in bacteria